MRVGTNRPINIVAVDPGTLHVGFAVVTPLGQVLRLGSIDPHSSLPLSVRLWKIEQEIHLILKGQTRGARVDFCLESPLVYRSNIATISLGCVRGVLLAQAARFRCRIFDYNNKSVKKGIAGRGDAEKEEVAQRVRLMCGLGDEELLLDTTDALAIAMYHRYQKYP